MSITALAKYYDLDWRTVKDVEKRNLERKYRSVSLSGVSVIGMDEIYVGKKNYKTVVRDLQSGKVLHVADGRGGEALDDFGKRVKRSNADIRVVAMDMSAGYASWVRDNLSEAQIVFDHFHVIKLMNDKVNAIRRRTAANSEDGSLASLKKKVSVPEKRGGS